MATIKLAGTALRELRIHLCQTSKSSEGVRQFIDKNYVSLKSANPGFPILVRECSGIDPCIWGRYAKGAERAVPVKDLAEKDVLQVVNKLAASK